MDASCSVIRKSGSSATISDNENVISEFNGSIIRNNISERDFLIRKAVITLNFEKVSSKFTASIWFKKPDSLLISVRSRLGMEAARAILTRDTLLINDRVNRKLLSGSTRWLSVKYGIENKMIFAALGDFIIDRKDENRKLLCSNGFYKDSYVINERNVVYSVDCRKRKVVDAYMEGGLTTGNISMVFTKFKKMSGMLFPEKIQISDDLKGTEVSIEIDNIETGWNGDIKFIPGNGYKVVYLR